MNRIPQLGLIFALALSPLMGCVDGEPSDSNPANPTQPTQPDPNAKPIAATATAAQKAFAEQLQVVLTEAKDLELDAFEKIYQSPEAPKTGKALGYDPMTATYMDLVTEKLKPNAAEKAKINANGFVVSERWNYPTMSQALLDVFKLDLPILVTTDMILQALHASYDDILKTLEREVIVAGIDTALQKVAGGVLAHDFGQGDFADAVRGDVDVYITVARALLSGNPTKAVTGAGAQAKVDALLKLIAAEKMTSTELFGASRKMDFSQFKPRGHYTEDEVLKRYFRAMMWMGRVDLRFMEADAFASGPEAKWIWRPRQVAAALALWQLSRDTEAMPHWQQAADLITLMVGPIDYIDFEGVEKIAQDTGWVLATDVETAPEADLNAVQAAMIAGKYGSQQIASHWISSNPHSSEVTPLAPSFAFLGQRFVVDSHVMANVVYDRILHKGQKVQRVMPSPLDVAFALGNDHAATHLKDEMKKHPYQGALHTMRWLIDSYEPSFWSSNVYNLWLDSLRTLNKPSTAEGFPAAMKTPAWHDKTLRTQLASWAQLRHDTILYAKQSYTAGVACEHPDGFVEPYPAFYQRLADLADTTGQALVNAPFENKYVKQQISTFFDNWKDHMVALRNIADKELKGEQLATEDVAFLKKTIVMETVCGGPIFNGWYTSLYFRSDNFDKFRPTIADVHTNPNQGPLPGPNVLHVATASVDLMVLTADTCEGAEAFVGPVFRYHEVDVKEIKRLNNDEWEKMLKEGKAPPQPSWTSSFLVPAP